jgi:flagellar assembly protein FliH
VSSSGAQRWEAPDFDPHARVATPAAPPPKLGPSVEELAEIEKAAREEGYAAGHAEGLAAGKAEVDRLQLQLSAMLRSLAAPLADLDQEVGDALGALAVRVAGALLEDAYVAEPERLASLIRATLDTAALERNAIEVRLHPQDLLLVKPLIEGDALKLVTDATLRRGDVRVHGNSLRVDAALETRLRSAFAALRVEEAPDA